MKTDKITDMLEEALFSAVNWLPVTSLFGVREREREKS